MSPKEPADLLLEARWVLPVAPLNTALADHAVVVTHGRIVALGPTVAMNACFEPNERVVRPRHALLPGFVNAHTWAAHALLRGLSREEVAAAERLCTTADFVRAGTQIAVAEMLQAGITCFGDMNAFPAEAARVAASARMHAAIGLPLSDTGDATEQMAKAEALWDAYRADPWVTLYFAPAAPHAISDGTLGRLRRVADELDARLAMPVHESSLAVHDSLLRGGHRPLARLQSLGLLRPGFTALHMTELHAADVATLTNTGVCVVACPQGNLWARAGICPVSQLQAAGITVGLGTDSAIRVGALDILAEARTATLTAGLQEGCGKFMSAPGLTAESALHMATLGGAGALGLNATIGSLEPGKAADMVCFDLESLACSPALRPHEAIVFAATRGQASDVWTCGRAALSAGRLLAYDQQEILALARQWSARVRREIAR